jgi:hypothetical protein
MSAIDRSRNNNSTSCHVRLKKIISWLNSEMKAREPVWVPASIELPFWEDCILAEGRGVVTQRTARQTRHSDRHGLAWRRHIRQRGQGTGEPAPASRPSHSSDSKYAPTSPCRMSMRRWNRWVAPELSPQGCPMRAVTGVSSPFGLTQWLLGEWHRGGQHTTQKVYPGQHWDWDLILGRGQALLCVTVLTMAPVNDTLNAPDGK